MTDSPFVRDAINGRVLCQVGQIDDATIKQLNRLVKSGKLQTWRGYWHPVPGGSWGIGPLKKCWGVTKPD